MRDFFIRSLEMVINVVVIIMAIGIVLGAGAAAFSPTAGTEEFGGMNGPLAGLLILFGGFVYLILVAGFMYQGLGIYQNTKRTAELLEARRT